MRQLIKKIIVWMIVKSNLPHLLYQEQERQNNCFIEKNVTNLGAKFYPEAVISNGQEKSKIRVGNGSQIRGNLNVFKTGGVIEIGEHCYIGDHSRIWSGESICIGNFVQISHNVNIMDTNSHEINARERAERSLNLPNDKNIGGNVLTAPIVIEDFVWIGFNATILKGVTIGEGAIVGANSVVTKDIPKYTMVVGNPARFIKKLNE